MDGFAYNQSVELSATDQTVYQQDVVIHRTTGVPYETLVGGLYEIHFFVGANCKADYGDIRFTNSAGVELAYYLWPDYDSSSARFAVRLVGADVAGTLQVWYGNPSATTTSDGDGTYLLHDHFDGSALNSSKWEVLENNGISVSDGALHVSSGAGNLGKLASRASIPPDILVQFRIQTRTYCTMIGVGNTNFSGEGSSIGLVYYTDYESAIYTGPAFTAGFGDIWSPPRTITVASTAGDVIANPPVGYFVEEFAIPEGDYLKERRNGGAWTTSTQYTGVSGSHPVHIAHNRLYGAMDLDYILVRAYSTNPPSAIAFSGEQVVGGSKASTGVALGSANMMVI